MPKDLPPRPMLPGNLDHTDKIWVGITKHVEPIVDAEDVLATHGFDFESPLEQLLLRLIDTYQPTDKDRQTRLRLSVAAITGKRLQKAPNYRERGFLLAVAREYHREYFQTRHEPELKTIIRNLLRHPEWQGLKTGTDDSSVGDLARKFTAARDLWLVRATTGQEWDPLERPVHLRRIAGELAELGVPIDTGPARALSKEK